LIAAAAGVRYLKEAPGQMAVYLEFGLLSRKQIAAMNKEDF
jgi:hypothetical protein